MITLKEALSELRAVEDILRRASTGELTDRNVFNDVADGLAETLHQANLLTKSELDARHE